MRHSFILWVLLIALLLCACGKTTDHPENTTTEPDDHVSPTNQTTQKVELTSDERAAYVIVIPENCDDIIIQAAESLKNELLRITGIAFTVTDDYTRSGNAEQSSGEIIIGNCKRVEMQAALSGLTYRDYSVSITEKNILIAAYEPVKVSDAVDALIQLLEEGHTEKSNGKVILNWSGDIIKKYTSYKSDGITLSGVPLNQYSIIYPCDAKTKTETDEYIKYAYEIQKHIGRRCGYVLDIRPDTDEPKDHEILIGKANRTESLALYAEEDAPKQLDYGVVIRNNKILILCGGLYSLSSACKTFNGILTGLSDSAMDAVKDSRATLASKDIPQPTGEYRFMTYNVLYEKWATGGVIPPEVEIRKEIVSFLILRYSPDVIALQETFDNWHRQLPDLIKDEYAFVCPKRSDNEVNRSPLIYKKDKLTLLDSGYIDIEQTVTVNRRVITWALFEDRNTKKQFYVLGTHWNPHSEEEKLAQSNRMGEYIKDLRSEHNLPVVAMGDFNSVPSNQSYQTFQSVSGLEKVSATSGVDHIFFSGAFTAVAQGYESGNCARYASDHFPVWIDMNLE